MRRTTAAVAAITLASSSLLATPLVHAQLGALSPSDPREFFKGKTMTYIVATERGGGYDTYGRLIAKYLGKHLGLARVEIRNLPGGGHIDGVNQIHAASPDGLTLGIFNTGVVYAQLLRNPAVHFDLGQMSWIGKAGDEPRVLTVSAKSGLRSLDDIRNAGRPLDARRQRRGQRELQRHGVARARARARCEIRLRARDPRCAAGDAARRDRRGVRLRELVPRIRPQRARLHRPARRRRAIGRPGRPGRERPGEHAGRQGDRRARARAGVPTAVDGRSSGHPSRPFVGTARGLHGGAPRSGAPDRSPTLRHPDRAHRRRDAGHRGPARARPARADARPHRIGDRR